MPPHPNETSIITLVCTAGGVSAIDVENAVVRGDREGEIGVRPSSRLPARVQPGREISFEVSYSPLDRELYATLRIDGRDVSTGRSITPVEISLRGRRGQPRIEVSPAGLDFGRVALGTSARKALLITNAGTDELVISNIELDTARTNSFQSTSPTSVVIGVGETRELLVDFDRCAPGASTRRCGSSAATRISPASRCR